MFRKSKKGYYFWEEIAEIDGIVHAFSTRKFGDMNWKSHESIKNLKSFCDKLNIDPTKAVRMEQVHGDNVKIVDYETSLFRHSGKSRLAGRIQNLSAQRVAAARDSGVASPGARRYLASLPRMTWVDNTDGFIAFQKGVFLVVTFADCVPALFLDKNKKHFGIVHAGWKGVYKEIVNKMVEKMVKKGSKPSDIMVGLGPSIRICCYDVYKERANSFETKFPQMGRITKVKNGRIFLDLIKIVKLQLKNSGILNKNILDCGVCTKDNTLDFYSFRKEGRTESFGLSCGIIGRV